MALTRTSSGQVHNGLVRYAKKNSSEMIAEVFAEWKFSSNPRPIAAAIGEFIDNHFKGR
ncbi:hypothetical protein [Actinomadura craniellae]|uniref:hypothetical protein n=1 Tax=Actinomadura craniellae TaxID=2231787 RepID=UPI001314A5D2|nr:hypothetical protein [Actinomadura craniellae]